MDGGFYAAGGVFYHEASFGRNIQSCCCCQKEFGMRLFVTYITAGDIDHLLVGDAGGRQNHL